MRVYDRVGDSVKALALEAPEHPEYIRKVDANLSEVQEWLIKNKDVDVLKRHTPRRVGTSMDGGYWADVPCVGDIDISECPLVKGK